MKTRIIQRRGQIALILVDPEKDPWDSDRVGVLTLYEGTKCWTLEDVRLAQYDVPNPWFSASADDYHARYLPKDEAEASKVRSMLQEYTEDENGTFHWCTYQGIVRGQPKINGYSPSWHHNDHSGYFSLAGGRAGLKEMQLYWEAYEGDPAKAKLPNPNAQMTQSQLFGELRFQEISIK